MPVQKWHIYISIFLSNCLFLPPPFFFFLKKSSISQQCHRTTEWLEGTLKVHLVQHPAMSRDNFNYTRLLNYQVYEGH